MDKNRSSREGGRKDILKLYKNPTYALSHASDGEKNKKQRGWQPRVG